MDLSEAARILGCTVLSGEIGEVRVEGCIASDLMSDVLAYSRPGSLLLTGLTTVQAVQTSNVADLAAVVFVSGKKPPREVLELAERKRIPVLATPCRTLEACGLLQAAGLRVEGGA